MWTRALVFAALLLVGSAHADEIDYFCIFTNAAAAQSDAVVGAYWNATTLTWDGARTFPNHKVTTAAALILGISPITGFQIIIASPGPNAALAGDAAVFMVLDRDAACKAQSFVLAAPSFSGTNRTGATISPVPAGACYPRPLGQ